MPVLLLCIRHAYGQNVATSIAVTDINIVDVVNAQVLSHQTVVISNGRISDVGPVGLVKVPTTATRVSGESRYIIPGLWDMHVHLRSNEKQPERPLVKENEAVLDLFLPNGVVGIRDMGETWRTTFSDGVMRFEPASEQDLVF